MWWVTRMRKLAAIAACASATFGCGKAASERVTVDTKRSLGAPVTYRNLSLVPVYDAGAPHSDTYMTLDEGLNARAVRVTEAPSGGDVNRLFVTNAGPKPLYLMAGEVVLGGQQDRCIGKDTVIPPDKRPIPITVYCVEHGRWSGRAEFAGSAGTVAGSAIRASAQDGSVVAARTAGERASRLSDSQSKVWDHVAEKNRRFGAAPSTGTYRDVLQGTGGSSGKSMAPYVTALSEALPDDPPLTGVVVAINGKPLAADVFGEPALFRKLWPKLLKSYAADAAEAARVGAAVKLSTTATAAKAFLEGAATGKSKTVDRSHYGVVTRREGRRALVFETAPATPAASKPLHENYVGK